MLNDQSTLHGQQLTVIITASYIKSHPSIRLIKQVLLSLKKINAHTCHIILAHDYNPQPDYLKYLAKLRQYTGKFPNVQIVQRSSKGHLTGNIRHAMSYVKTKYILVLQHDLPFIRKFDINTVIADMELNPQLKHIKFFKKGDKNPKNVDSLAWDLKNSLFGQEVQARHNTYTRTPAWSDQNHICLTAYYKEIVLPECPDGTIMEATLNNVVNESNHEKYGTYLMGSRNDGEYIKHTDGAKALRLVPLDVGYKFLNYLERTIRKYLKKNLSR